MVLYFSATGNTRFVAETLGAAMNDSVLDLLSRIRENDISAICSKKPFVICSPVYVSEMPRFLMKLTAALKPLTIVSLIAVIFCVTTFFTLSQIFDTVVLIAFITVLTVFFMPFQMLETVEEIVFRTLLTNPLIAFQTEETTA